MTDYRQETVSEARGPGALNTAHRGPRRSLRTRLLLATLGLTLVGLAVIVFAAVSLAGNVIGQAQEVTSQSLRQQAETYLAQINTSIAGQSALILDRAARDVKSLADTARMVYSGQVDLPDNIVSMSMGPEGQRMNGPNDISSVFVPNITWQASTYDPALNAAVQHDIELTAFLDLTLPSIKNNNPNAAAIYIGTPHNVLRYYPNIELGKVVPPDFAVTQRPWYLSSLENNPDPTLLRPIWSPVYYDATGLGLVTTIAMPVYSNAGELAGVVGLDVTLEEVRRNIEASRFLSSGYSFMIDDQGGVIILPDAGYRDLLGIQPNPEQPTPNLIELATNPELASTLERMAGGEQGFKRIQLNGREYYMAYTPVAVAAGGEMTTPGWSLASVVAADDVLVSVAGMQAELRAVTRQGFYARILPAGFFIALLAVAVAWWGINRLVDPILQLSASAEKLGAGDWEAPLPTLQQVEAHNDDEIGLLAHTIEGMAGQLQRTFGQLEHRVAERTQALEYRTLQIQTAAEVAREITAAQDMDALLNGAVNLISERFGYYNVGIFLVDETSEYAHLKAASGELGKRLVQRDVRLRVGEQGLVGYVTRFGVARRSQDVGQDSLYFAEPLLSETQAEATLPLRSEGKIIGALDVQQAAAAAGSSAQAPGFSDDDLTALQTLADQLATAIENVRLVERLRATLQETDRLFQQQARQAWRRINAGAEARAGAGGMEYDRLEVRPLTTHALPPAEEQSRGVLRVPMTLRGQVIGYIGLESDDPRHEWSADELAIVEATAAQAVLTVENARLLADSQRRATREKISAEVGARLQASLDPQVVLHTAVQEIALQLGIAEVSLELLPDADELRQAQDEPAGSAEAPQSVAGDAGSQAGAPADALTASSERGAHEPA